MMVSNEEMVRAFEYMLADLENDEISASDQLVSFQVSEHKGEMMCKLHLLHASGGSVTVERTYDPEMFRTHFTDRFDSADYESFYLEVTSAMGLDEGNTPKQCAEMVKEVITQLPLWRIVYYHKMAGETDTAYVRASASGNALIKFAATCVQPDEIDIRTCEKVEVVE